VSRVIIGMDPHKRSATIEVLDERENVLAVGRYGTDKAGYAAMLEAGREFADRAWAVEGCAGIGKHLAHRLVHDGETVFDVPAKLSARVRVFATGNGRRPTRWTHTRSRWRRYGRRVWCRCRWIRTCW
jgi:transposase